jgi:hypothetical protein
MKYILGIWTTICIMPFVYFLFQDTSAKGVSITDLKNTFLIFAAGLSLIYVLKKITRFIDQSSKS